MIVRVEMPFSAPLRAVCYALAACGLSLLALTIAARIGSIWPLEWMESASLQHALLLWSGEHVYIPPSADFIPFVYPPLSYLPMALSSRLFGPSLIAARVPSVLALALSLWCIGRTLARETDEPAIGWLGAGLYALGFGYTGAFADLARVDSLFIALVLLAAERLSAGALGSALVWLALSCLAKQHGLVFLSAVSLGVYLRDGRAALGRLSAAWGFLAVCSLGLAAASGGWYWRYVFAVPAGHGIVPSLLASYLAVDVCVYLPLFALCCVLPLIRRSRAPSLWELWLLAGLCASALGRAHPGGDDNVRLPGFAFLVLVGTLGFAELYASARSNAVRGVWLVALTLQAAVLVQPPAAHAPRPDHARGFETLQAALVRCGEGNPSVALDHALLTGHPFLHTMALSDLRTSSDRTLAREATAALLERLAGPDAPAALAVSASFEELDARLRERYLLCEEVSAWPMPTGYSPGPTRVYQLNAAP